MRHRLSKIVTRLPLWALSAAQISLDHFNQGLAQFIARVEYDLAAIDGRGPIFHAGATTAEKVDATADYLRAQAQRSGVIPDREDVQIAWPLHDHSGSVS